MLETWVLLAVSGAFLQNLRSLLQRRLAGALSVQGASYVRFLYALPLAWAYCISLEAPWPAADSWHAFAGYCAAGGIAQIVGTFCLVGAVSHGSFAVGTAYSKTEAAQAALFGLVLLADAVTAQLVLAIAVSFAGVALLAYGSAPVSSDWFDRRVLLLGLGAGAGFALSAVCFRGAALSLPDGSTLARAGLTLAVTLSIQTVLQGGYLFWRDRAALRGVFASYRVGWCVGLVGMLASLCWFTAMTIHPAAQVRAVGQIEMLFTVFTGVLLLRERISALELGGIALILLGIGLLLL